MRGGQRDVDIARLPDRLAVVQALQDRELPGPLLQDPGDPVQVLGPLRPGHRSPDLLVGGASGGHGPVHVGGTGRRHLSQRLLIRRILGDESLPVGGGPNSPFRNKPYSAARFTTSRDSGAGAYSHSPAERGGGNARRRRPRGRRGCPRVPACLRRRGRRAAHLRLASARVSPGWSKARAWPGPRTRRLPAISRLITSQEMPLASHLHVQPMCSALSTQTGAACSRERHDGP